MNGLTRVHSNRDYNESGYRKLHDYEYFRRTGRTIHPRAREDYEEEEDPNHTIIDGKTIKIKPRLMYGESVSPPKIYRQVITEVSEHSSDNEDDEAQEIGIDPFGNDTPTEVEGEDQREEQEQTSEDDQQSQQQ